jgi:hypothetical protein
MPVYQIRSFRIPAWQLILVAAAGLALLVAFLVAAVGVLLLLLPVFVVAGAIAYLYGRFRQPPRKARTSQFDVIDAEYRVIENGRDRSRQEGPTRP